MTKTKKARIRRVAEKVTDLRAEARAKNLRAPGIAEFLDAVWACLDTGIDPDGDRWESVQSMTLAKDVRWDEPATPPKASFPSTTSQPTRSDQTVVGSSIRGTDRMTPRATGYACPHALG